ncbi:MAG: MerR family transcriptional regulator [Campylobacterota bacterium]|nr:MerR family transcriptional regulator [Campylobacterota bacterium]
MSFDNKGKSYCEPVYLISEVSKILDIHPQTLRQYEREGLITPSRTNGKIRLYSQEDIDCIKNILNLTRNKGINISGVSMILKLQQEIKVLNVTIDEFRLKDSNSISNSKALVVKKSQYDIVVVED